MVREGDDALLVGCRAGDGVLGLAGRRGSWPPRAWQCAVVALPWLNGIDGAWLGELAGDGPVLCLDNHSPGRAAWVTGC